MFIYKIYSLLLLFLSVFINCSNNVATGGTETGNPVTIAGTVYDKSGDIAVGVNVTLLPVNYNPVADAPVATSFVHITDSLGRYSFINLGHDTFNLEIVDDEAKTKALRISITAQESDFENIIDTLRPFGTIKVLLPGDFNTTTGYVYIAGTTIYKKVTSKTICLDDVSSGVVPKIVYISNSDTNILIDSMSVEPNDTAVQAQALYLTNEKHDSLGIITGIITGKLREFGISVRIINSSEFNSSDTIGVSVVIISPVMSNKDTIVTVLKNSQLPIVNMEYLLLADLGMTDTVSGVDYGIVMEKQLLCDIIDSTHVIADEFSGTVKLFSDSVTMEWGNPSVEAVKIATISDNPDMAVVFFYEKDSDMFGMKAPAKRIGFLIGGYSIDKAKDGWWHMYRNMIKWLFE